MKVSYLVSSPHARSDYFRRARSVGGVGKGELRNPSSFCITHRSLPTGASEYADALHK